MQWESCWLSDPNWMELFKRINEKGKESWKLLHVDDTSHATSSGPRYFAILQRPLQSDIGIAIDCLKDRGMDGAAEVLRREFGIQS